MKGSGGNGSDTFNGAGNHGMGPKEKYSLFGPYRQQWGSRR